MQPMDCCARIALMVLVSVTLPAFGDDADVQMTGQLQCTDGDGFEQPLAFVPVTMWDSDCDGSSICDEFMARARTDVDGRFTLAGRGGDLFSLPDPYVRVHYASNGDVPDVNTGPFVLLKDDVDQTWTYDINPHGHNDSFGNIDIGPVKIGSDRKAGESSKCAVLLAAAREVTAHRHAAIGMPQPIYLSYPAYLPAYTSETPWTSRNTIHWRTYYSWRPSMAHEFGHLVRHFNDGDDNHFSWDATRFRYGRGHGYCDSKHLAETDYNRLGYAFNEGWAHFRAGIVRGCGVCTNAAAPTLEHCTRSFQCDSSHGAGDGVCDASDMTVEGNVAQALSSLSRCPSLPVAAGQCVNSTRRFQACMVDIDCNNAVPAEGGRCDRTAWSLVNVLVAEEGSIHTLEEFESHFTGATGCGVATRILPLAADSSADGGFARAASTYANTSRQFYKQVADRIVSDWRSAAASAATIKRCTGKDRCGATIRQLVAPYVLQAELELLELRVRMISARDERLGQTPQASALLALDGELRSNGMDYERAAAKIYSQALANAATAVEAFARKDRNAAPYVNELTHKSKSFKDLMRGEKGLEFMSYPIPVDLDTDGYALGQEK